MTSYGIPPAFSDCTFENFIVGAGNREAFETCWSIATLRRPDELGPLVLNGSSGMGKTHLLAAVAAKMIEHVATAKVIFVSYEEFRDQARAFAKRGDSARFNDRYSACNALFIHSFDFGLTDDCDPYAEFLPVAQRLMAGGALLALDYCEAFGDAAPLGHELRKLLMSGITVTVSDLDEGDVAEIVRRRSIALAVPLSGSAVDELASRPYRSVREIEMTLLRTKALASVHAR